MWLEIVSVLFFIFGFLWIPFYVLKIGSVSFSQEEQENNNNPQKNELDTKNPEKTNQAVNFSRNQTNFFSSFGTIGIETKRFNSFFHNTFGKSQNIKQTQIILNEKEKSQSVSKKHDLKTKILRIWFLIGTICVILASFVLASFLFINFFKFFWVILQNFLKRSKDFVFFGLKSTKSSSNQEALQILSEISQKAESTFAENLKKTQNSQFSFVLLIPGFNIPLHDTIFIVSAMFVAVIFHELGHAISAVVSSHKIKFVGVRQFFWFLMAYVSLEPPNLSAKIEEINKKQKISQEDSEKQNNSNSKVIVDNLDTQKQILGTRKKYYFKQLVVDAAGIWHNIITCFLVFIFSICVFKFNLFSIYETVPFENYEIIEKNIPTIANNLNSLKIDLNLKIGGVFVHENRSPAVFPDLKKGDIVEGIRSHSQNFQFCNNIQEWYQILYGNTKNSKKKDQKNTQILKKEPENESFAFDGIKNEANGIGYLISRNKILEEFEKNKDLDCCKENSNDPSYLCFYFFPNSHSKSTKQKQKQKICLKAREVIQFPRCFDQDLKNDENSECVFLETFADEKIIELKVRGRQQTVLFLGDVDFLAENVIVSEMKINQNNILNKIFRNLKPDLEFFSNLEKILGYFVSLSSGVAILNMLPLRGFDGDYILDQICEIWFVFEIEKMVSGRNNNNNPNLVLLKKKDFILKLKKLIRILSLVLLVSNILLAGLQIIF